jgi:hypothetical protein
MVVTLLMNMFFGSRLKGMPPKLVSDDGQHVVIRPLAYVAEPDLERWAEHRRFPIIPCTLCGSQENLQRVQVKKMLREWERDCSRPHRQHVDARWATCRALAPDGPETLSVHDAPNDGRARSAGRQGLRRATRTAAPPAASIQLHRSAEAAAAGRRPLEDPTP